MSIDPTGFVASAGGTPLAQARGTEVGRIQAETAAQSRQVASEDLAEQAAGIGQADGEEHATGERDVDGRRLWEAPEEPKRDSTVVDQTPAGSGQNRPECGQLIDLVG